MKTAYFDCIFGVSGDMTLGALVSCGVPLEHLKNELAKLGLDGYELTAETVKHSGISAVQVHVATEEQHTHRHLGHILDIIDAAPLTDRVKKNAAAVFSRLAEAEAKVHDTTPEKIHFHEVGALDAIIDVVGACIGLDYLGVEEVMSTPLHVGTGTVMCAHGVMPVPVPAVVELTRNVPVVRTSYEGEITTPTGAAIVTTMAGHYGEGGIFSGETVGYGVGSKTWDDHPNMLRIIVGEMSGAHDVDHSVLLETNIDDMNPEMYGYIYDKLFDLGAYDVYMIPIYMKKGRPGTLLSVIADEMNRDRLTDVILSETTTLGVRISRISRRKLRRDSRTVPTRYGDIRVKIAKLRDGERITPEYEDCSRIAREKGIPLIKVYDTVRKAYDDMPPAGGDKA